LAKDRVVQAADKAHQVDDRGLWNAGERNMERFDRGDIGHLEPGSGIVKYCRSSNANFLEMFITEGESVKLEIRQ
jgi:hypothetical protein